jgi:hypothetical protein
MSAAWKYALWGVLAVSLAILALSAFLDTAALRGVVIAALVALPIQIVAFAGLVHYRSRTNGFLAVWAGGTLVRLVVVGLVAFLAIRSGADGTIAMLLALAGFFFGLLLLEPIYFRPRTSETR